MPKPDAKFVYGMAPYTNMAHLTMTHCVQLDACALRYLQIEQIWKTIPAHRLATSYYGFSLLG